MGISAILGHNFSLFLGFKGGKGVATSIGVLLIYSPQIAIFTLIIWLVVVLMTKHSSLGAIMSFGLLPVNVWLFDYSKVKLITSAVITILILSRHIGNIERLIKGTEKRLESSIGAIKNSKNVVIARNEMTKQSKFFNELQVVRLLAPLAMTFLRRRQKYFLP